LLVIALIGCTSASGAPEGDASQAAGPRAIEQAATGPAASSTTPRATRTADPSPPAAYPSTNPRRAKARPAGRALLSIPAIGVRALPVLPYTGAADDRPGTRIQDRGVAASPRGRKGGVGQGEIGNYIVTAHRTSAGGPFRRLPAVRAGAHVLVASGDVVYDYVVTETLTISFRSARDRARQSAPVPGRLGQSATRAMITLSTCATPEDRARGNYWTDELGNPEHRIDKVGVLLAVRPA
jgi:sortase A